ncbi:MAG: hypothetical protein ACI4JJ_04580, partial [Huintestinicola sp.]
LRALPPLLKVFPLQGNELSIISKKQYGKEQNLSFLKRAMQNLPYSNQTNRKKLGNGYKISTVTEPRTFTSKQTNRTSGCSIMLPQPACLSLPKK